MQRLNMRGGEGGTGGGLGRRLVQATEPLHDLFSGKLRPSTGVIARVHEPATSGVALQIGGYQWRVQVLKRANVEESDLHTTLYSPLRAAELAPLHVSKACVGRDDTRGTSVTLSPAYVKGEGRRSCPFAQQQSPCVPCVWAHSWPEAPCQDLHDVIGVTPMAIRVTALARCETGATTCTTTGDWPGKKKQGQKRASGSALSSPLCRLQPGRNQGGTATGPCCRCRSVSCGGRGLHPASLPGTLRRRVDTCALSVLLARSAS